MNNEPAVIDEGLSHRERLDQIVIEASSMSYDPRPDHIVSFTLVAVTIASAFIGTPLVGALTNSPDPLPVFGTMLMAGLGLAILTVIPAAIDDRREIDKMRTQALIESRSEATSTINQLTKSVQGSRLTHLVRDVEYVERRTISLMFMSGRRRVLPTAASGVIIITSFGVLPTVMDVIPAALIGLVVVIGCAVATMAISRRGKRMESARQIAYADLDSARYRLDSARMDLS